MPLISFGGRLAPIEFGTSSLPLDDSHRFCLKRLDSAQLGPFLSDINIDIGLILSYIQDTALEFGFEKSSCRRWEVRGQTPVGSFLAETTRVWSYSRKGLQLSAF